MGEKELADIDWDESTLTLSGTCIRPAGESGNLYIHVPPQLRVVNPEGLWIAKDANDESLIVGVRCTFTGTPFRWSVNFVPLKSTEDTVDTGKSGDW
jgi:hypothetical protein